VNVPEAEPFVSAPRERFDPSADAGAPAHITLLHPFVDPVDIGAAILRTLDEIFLGATAFVFRLAAVRRFPGHAISHARTGRTVRRADRSHRDAIPRPPAVRRPPRDRHSTSDRVAKGDEATLG